MVFKWVQLNLSTLIILHCYFLNTQDLFSPFLGIITKLQKATMSIVMSARME
jgi:hypothetical protein